MKQLEVHLFTPALHLILFCPCSCRSCESALTRPVDTKCNSHNHTLSVEALFSSVAHKLRTNQVLAICLISYNVALVFFSLSSLMINERQFNLHLIEKLREGRKIVGETITR